MTEIQGTINNIIYKNEESGYAVLGVTEKENGHTITVVFNNCILPLKKGVCFRAEGEWVSSKYGRQFAVSSYKEVLPSTTNGIIAYLSCGLFKGIGEKFAKKLVDAFGEKTIEVLENEPKRALEIKGVGEKKLLALSNGLKDHKFIQNIIEFFSAYEISLAMVLKIYKRYGEASIDYVKENPYRLCYEIDGFGFKKADEIALKLGVELTSEDRIQACVDYILAQEGENGHTFLIKGALARLSAELLEIPPEHILGSIDNLSDQGKVVLLGDCVFSKSLYFAERNVFNKIMRLLKMSRSVEENVSIEKIEEEVHVEYNEKQKEAIRCALSKNLMILTGGPGTGKTTVLLGLIHYLRKSGFTIACAAPTGMAAKRMSNVTNMNAKTIHRLLEYKPNEGFTRNEAFPLPHDVVIIDEFSMVNIYLMSSLIDAIKPTSKVILVGDENQLPAIGPGNVLHDMLESGIVPTVTLTEIFRQAEGSHIILNSHNIINNLPLVINNSDKNNDFFFVNEEDPDRVSEYIKDLVLFRLPKNFGIKPRDIQVLSPRRRNAGCCANELSYMLQDAINPHGAALPYGQHEFRVGDKVMQIKNNYDNDVFNGDVGIVVGVNPDDRTMDVNYDGSVVTYDGSTLDQVILAYASTVHKSQGSEYPIVIIPLLSSFTIMLKRNLIYTAITRAKDLCIIIGDRRALYRAISDTSYDRRNTMLKTWLKEGCEDPEQDVPW